MSSMDCADLSLDQPKLNTYGNQTNVRLVQR